MSPKRKPMKPREVVRLLTSDGWTIKRKGPGDHVQYVHTTKTGKITIDMGVRNEFPTETLKSIFEMAGWDW